MSDEQTGTGGDERRTAIRRAVLVGAVHRRITLKTSDPQRSITHTA